MADLSPEEYAHWLALFRVDPWGEQRADLRAGIIAATIANVNRGKNTQAFKPNKFMPYIPKRDKRRDVADRLKKALTPWREESEV